MKDKPNKKPQQFYDVFRKESKDFIPHWRRDNYLTGSSLDHIVNFLSIIQKKGNFGDYYKELQEVQEKRKGLVYKFKLNRNFEGEEILDGLPEKFTYYKIIPKLKLRE